MHGHGSIVETVGTFSGPSFRGRPIKFTPERIQQIKNLVEGGNSREDIAELVGVTVGSLAVTWGVLLIVIGQRRGRRSPPTTELTGGNKTRTARTTEVNT